MTVASQHNAVLQRTNHNDSITRPRIFFCVGRYSRLVPGNLYEEIFGRKPPVTAKYREFLPGHLMPGSSDYSLYEAGTSSDGRAVLQALTLLRAVLSRPPEDEIARQAMLDATKALVPGHAKAGLDMETFYKGKDLREIAKRTYTALFNQELKHARIWLPPGSVVPVLVCPDIRTAAFAYHAYRGVSACLNCRRQFATDFPHEDGSRSESYCSVRCGQRYRQRLYRMSISKIVREAKGKGGK